MGEEFLDFFFCVGFDCWFEGFGSILHYSGSSGDEVLFMTPVGECLKVTEVGTLAGCVEVVGFFDEVDSSVFELFWGELEVYIANDVSECEFECCPGFWRFVYQVFIQEH